MPVLNRDGQIVRGKILRGLKRVFEKELGNEQNISSEIQNVEAQVTLKQFRKEAFQKDISERLFRSILDQLEDANVLLSPDTVEMSPGVFMHIVEESDDDESYFYINFPIDFEARLAKYEMASAGSEDEEPNDFESPIPSMSSDRKSAKAKPVSEDDISVQTQHGLLTLNKDLGDFRLNNVSGNITPAGQEFNVLLKLMTLKNNKVTYADVITGTVSKDSKRKLTFVIRNLKTTLEILPTDKAKNENIISNIPKVGYKLLV